MFSLPKPLPKPQPAFGIVGSDTATLPYPIKQALATPPSSLARGDWGLKRPLPLRTTTKTSTPVFRINSLDTIEHITDFESAADHTLTLQKWQEMGLAVADEGDFNRGSAIFRASKTKPMTSFESSSDNTVNSNRRGEINMEDRFALRSKETYRWKFSGPSIDTLSGQQFEQYLDKVLGKERQQFQAHLKEYIRAKHISDKRIYARERGTDFDEAAAEPTEQDYNDRWKLLRDEVIAQPGNSELERIIVEYFDLPPTKAVTSLTSSTFESDNNDAHSVRTTHPSAGLSYLRSHAVLENHPVLGPQYNRSPVEARVLKPRIATGKASNKAVLGVGGIVASEGGGSFLGTRAAQEDPTGLTRLLPNVEGGSKVWVHPTHAVIARNGRIKLMVDHAEVAQKEIRQGVLPTWEIPIQSRNGNAQRHRQDEPLDAALKPAKPNSAFGRSNIIMRRLPRDENPQ